MNALPARCLILAAVAVALLPSPAAAEDESSAATEANWIQIFNGRDLEGWTAKITGYPVGENFGDTFRVEDGVIRVVYDGYDGEFRDRFGHLFYKDTFSNYVLRVEYRFVGEQLTGGPSWAVRNSGVMFHGQTPESMSVDQRFPVSLEYQMLGGDGQEIRTTGNLCTPGTHVVMHGELVTEHCTDSSSETYHGDQWVTAEIEVHGGRLIRHRVNGQTVLEYRDPQLDPTYADTQPLLESGAERHVTSGTISLQSESHPVEFRKVELLRLDD